MSVQLVCVCMCACVREHGEHEHLAVDACNMVVIKLHAIKLHAVTRMSGQAAGV